MACPGVGHAPIGPRTLRVGGSTSATATRCRRLVPPGGGGGEGGYLSSSDTVEGTRAPAVKLGASLKPDESEGCPCLSSGLARQPSYPLRSSVSPGAALARAAPRCFKINTRRLGCPSLCGERSAGGRGQWGIKTSPPPQKKESRWLSSPGKAKRNGDRLPCLIVLVAAD